MNTVAEELISSHIKGKRYWKRDSYKIRLYNFDRDVIINRYMIICTKKPVFEIPLTDNLFSDGLVRAIVNSDTLMIDYPARFQNDKKFSAAGSAAVDAMNYCDNYDDYHGDRRIQQVVLTKDGEVLDKFYAGKGIILDKESRPLLYACYRMSYKKAPNLYSINSLVIKVHPIVYSDNTSLYKFIRDTYLTNALMVGSVKILLPSINESDNFTERLYEIPVKAEISKDIENLFEYNESPRLSLFTNESVNRITLEHMDNMASLQALGE